jgi:hypothetical protein
VKREAEEDWGKKRWARGRGSRLFGLPVSTAMQIGFKIEGVDYCSVE